MLNKFRRVIHGLLSVYCGLASFNMGSRGLWLAIFVWSVAAMSLELLIHEGVKYHQ